MGGSADWCPQLPGHHDKFWSSANMPKKKASNSAKAGSNADGFVRQDDASAEVSGKPRLGAAKAKKAKKAKPKAAKGRAATAATNASGDKAEEPKPSALDWLLTTARSGLEQRPSKGGRKARGGW